MLCFTTALVAGFEPLEHTITEMLRPYYFLFEIYAVGYFVAVPFVLAYGSMKQEPASWKLRNNFMLIGLLPFLFVVLAVVILGHFGMRYINATDSTMIPINTTVLLPVVVTFLLAVTAYAVHQHRLFDIQFYIPWSKVRQRKTAFYRRIRGMIADIANLPSVNEAVSQLARTLGCAVALVDSKATVAAAGRYARPHDPDSARSTTEAESINTLAVRWGLKWRYSPRLTLHAGLGYDPRPTVNIDVSPNINMLRKIGLGLGGSFALKNGLRLDFAYQFIRGKRRDVSESKQDDLAPLGDTSVFEGEYSSRTHVIGIDLMGRF